MPYYQITKMWISLKHQDAEPKKSKESGSREEDSCSSVCEAARCFMMWWDTFFL